MVSPILIVDETNPKNHWIFAEDGGYNFFVHTFSKNVKSIGNVHASLYLKKREEKKNRIQACSYDYQSSF